jgi:chromosome segregation ATPase
VRLKSIKIKHFRSIIEKEIEFPETGVTVIWGPNEIGKSCIAEALYLLFTYKDSSKDSDVIDVRPLEVNENPEVEAHLTLGDHDLVYTKTWGHNKSTLLRISKPKPETFKGLNAHNKAIELLDKHVDLNLYYASQHLQRVSVDKKYRINQSLSLKSALDAMPTGLRERESEASTLWQKVEARYAQYYSKNKEKKEIIDARRKLQEVKNEYDEINNKLNSLIEAGDQLLSRRAQIADIRAEIPKKSHELKEVENALSKVDNIESRITDLNNSYKLREKDKEQIEDKINRIKQEMQRLKENEDEIRQLNEKLAKNNQEKNEKEQLLKNLESSVNDVRQKCAETKRLRDIIDLKLQYVESKISYDLLQARWDDLVAAKKESADYSTFLETCKITEDTREEFRKLQKDYDKARFDYEASLPTIKIQAFTDVTIKVGDEPIALSSGETKNLKNLESPINIDDKVELSVEDIESQHKKLQKRNQAKQRLENFLKDYELPENDPENHIDNKIAERQKAEISIEAAGSKIKKALFDLSEEELREKFERSSAKLDQLKSSISNDLPDKSQKEELQRQLEEASRAHDYSQSKLDQFEKQIEHLTSSLDKLTESNNETSATIKIKKENIEKLRDDLDDSALESLISSLEAVKGDLDKIEREISYKESEWAELNKNKLISTKKNLEDFIKHRNEDLRKLEDEVIRLENTISIYRQDDLQTKKEDLEERLYIENLRVAEVERNAEASKLLYNVFKKHREQVASQYLAPLSEELSRLGRMVFAPDVKFELNSETFEVKTRASGTRNEPKDYLSTGAKEQLSVLYKLACVSLARSDKNNRGTFPIFLDDALGYSDPNRLRDMALIFNEVSNYLQIIILTADPERYRNIGSSNLINFN